MALEMSITIMLAATDLECVQVKRLSMNVETDQAVVELFHKPTKKSFLEARIWMWMQNGEWLFGWSAVFAEGYKATDNFKDKIKDELYKVLLPYFNGSVFDGSLSAT